MYVYKRFVVAQHERGFLFRDSQLIRVLEPGVHRCFDPLGRVRLELHDLGQIACTNKNAEILVKTVGGRLEPYLVAVAMSDDEIGLVYRDERFVEVLAPAERQVY